MLTAATPPHAEPACRGEDPELFFPTAHGDERVAQLRAAKAVCGRCPVREACLAYAEANPVCGVWGGRLFGVMRSRARLDQTLRMSEVHGRVRT